MCQYNKLTSFVVLIIFETHCESAGKNKGNMYYKTNRATLIYTYILLRVFVLNETNTFHNYHN